MPAHVDVGPVSRHVQTDDLDGQMVSGITPLRRVDPVSPTPPTPSAASRVDVGIQAPDKLGSGADSSKFIPLSVWPER